jgi:hypothetical protein
MLCGQSSDHLKEGDAVRRTDTDRRARVIELNSPFVARVQFHDGSEDWCPLSLLERITRTGVLRVSRD